MNALLIALSVVGGILLLLVSILCLGAVSARITFEDKLTVRVSAFGIFKFVFPQKKAEKPLRDVAGADPKALLKAEEKRRKRAEKEAARKRKKQAKKEAAQAKKTAAEPKPNLKENLDMVLAILKRAYALTKGKVRVEFRKMHLRVATGDAASTAILYGVILQNVAYLLQWTQDHFNEIHRREGDMTVKPDYLAERPSLELDLRLRVAGPRAIGIALKMLHTYRTEKRRAKLRAKKRTLKNAEKQPK